ncbi:MAG: hypothetical protein KC470_04750, partial [Dehalococcoidia bacterium]|nr:hypothetical protein [Dehalococcoidia bacterium]
GGQGMEIDNDGQADAGLRRGGEIDAVATRAASGGKATDGIDAGKGMARTAEAGKRRDTALVGGQLRDAEARREPGP